ncbi:MAG: (d)CMP kinase, partial [Oscillospiraceae bacterium]
MKAVAIDGPAGAGKSSIAKQAALELGFIYVDTGALYRVIALNALTNNIDTQNEQAICDSLDLVKVELKFINGSQCVFLNGVDVSSEIRKPQVSMCASQVSAIPRVREFLFGLQQDIAAKNNVIMDGR